LSIKYRGKSYDSPDGAIKALNENYKNLPKRALPKVKKIMDEYAKRVIIGMKAKHGRPYPNGTSDTTLSRRSGKGYKSWRNRTTMNLAKNQVSVKIDKVGYYHFQETGATVTPSNRKYLAIPLPAALNDDGTPQKDSLSDWDNTFIRKSKSNPENLVVYVKLSNKRAVPIYALTKRVKLPPRLGFQKAKNTLLPIYLDKIKKEIKLTR